MSPTISMRVIAMRLEAEGVLSLELQPVDEHIQLPEAQAGAHIDLHLDNGLVRSYSLVIPRCSSTTYTVGVLHDKSSRGGSSFIHNQLRVGDKLTISAPRNHFQLNENAPKSVLIAGGIGITPIYSMFARLNALQHPVELLYCVRTQEQAAFKKELEQLGSVAWHIDEEAGKAPDLKGYLQTFPSNTHFYCCGPAPMLDAFEKACADLQYEEVHIERFSPIVSNTSAKDAHGYTVHLQRSQKVVQVHAGQSLQEVLVQAGIDIPFSCREGICGSCETKVLDGTPDHHDSVLSKAEKQAGKVMMVCVSGCQGDKLVLDL